MIIKVHIFFIKSYPPSLILKKENNFKLHIFRLEHLPFAICVQFIILSNDIFNDKKRNNFQECLSSFKDMLFSRKHLYINAYIRISKQGVSNCFPFMVLMFI